jgi:hypothetical protein
MHLQQLFEVEEMAKSLKHEAVGEVRRLDSPYILEEPTKPSIPPEEAVRSVQPLGHILPSHSDISVGMPDLILYRNESVLLEIHDQLRPDSLLDKDVQQKLRMLIRSRPRNIYPENLNGVNEFVLKPTAEWVLSAEDGAEFEFKWSMASRTNTNNIVLMLLAAMPTRDLEEVHREIKMQRAHTFAERLVYPSMPIKVRGVVRTRRDITAQEMCLRNHKCSARVLLDSQHMLSERMTLLRQRHVCVLGIVQSVKKLTIRAGAILVGQATTSWCGPTDISRVGPGERTHRLAGCHPGGVECASAGGAG